MSTGKDVISDLAVREALHLKVEAPDELQPPRRDTEHEVCFEVMTTVTGAEHRPEQDLRIVTEAARQINHSLPNFKILFNGEEYIYDGFTGEWGSLVEVCDL